MHWFLKLLSVFSYRLFWSKLTSTDLGPLATEFILHALRSPLTDILLTTEVVLSTSSLPANSFERDALIHIVHSLQYVSNITKNTVSAKMAIFPVFSALEEVLKQRCHSHQQHSIFISTQLSKYTYLKGNQFFFQEMINCLIQNSFEAYDRSRHPLISLSCHLDGNEILIYIADGGRGMNQATQKSALQPGFSGKKNHSGLGLSFVKQVAQLHFKGKFTIHSYPAKGTIMCLRLPVYPVDSQNL